ncbi:hypothetical protein HDU77_004948 [Chytriomyces hyalinus]|nr:hypothetical protein HDU77_004948 [Chytriomyces hyalinus]
MDAIDSQLAQLKEEIDAQKNEQEEAEKAFEKAIREKDPVDCGNLRSSFVAAAAQLSVLRERKLELMRQKDRLTAVIKAKQVKEIPEDTANLLFNYLSVIKKCFGPYTTGGSQCLHFIAPILIHVCTLFKGDATILVEEELDGVELKAHGRFAFVLRRGNKMVCIVQAKKGNFRQGLAEDLLGCEVAAERYNLDKVMGIVTDYVQWVFLRSLDERIEMDHCSLEMSNGQPSRSSLLNIAGKIYSMLSD